MSKTNEEKTRQLGMSHSTVAHILRKSVLFSLVRRCGLDSCHQCGKVIENIDEFSIEHKVPWLYSPDAVELFFDLDNIAFSHLSCNISAGRRMQQTKHPSTTTYHKGCQCDGCKAANAKKHKEYMQRKKQKQTL